MSNFLPLVFGATSKTFSRIATTEGRLFRDAVRSFSPCNPGDPRWGKPAITGTRGPIADPENNPAPRYNLAERYCSSFDRGSPSCSSAERSLGTGDYLNVCIMVAAAPMAATRPGGERGGRKSLLAAIKFVPVLARPKTERLFLWSTLPGCLSSGATGRNTSSIRAVLCFEILAWK